MIHRKGWDPTRRAMTSFANTRGVDVAVRQIMATGAGAGAIHLRMIHRKGGNPTRRTMTRFANTRGVNVAVRQIVATGAGAGAIHLRMIHCGRWDPAGC